MRDEGQMRRPTTDRDLAFILTRWLVRWSECESSDGNFRKAEAGRGRLRRTLVRSKTLGTSMEID